MAKSYFLAALAAGSVLVSAGISAHADDTDELVPGYERTGETRTCLSLAAIRDMKAIDDDHLLVRVGTQRFINELSGSCKGASSPSTYIQYSTSIGQLCRHDIIKVFDSSGDFLRGSCGLGEFELLKKVEAE